jgi:multidrug resistance efflux pump
VNGVAEFYITASFKSNQVQHLLKGQSAKIVVDDFPELSLSGKITGLSNLKNESPLSSPGNQSGNYVKMVERFPVTIKVEIPSAEKNKFKSRMSCTVRVSTAP